MQHIHKQDEDNRKDYLIEVQWKAFTNVLSKNANLDVLWLVNNLSDGIAPLDK